MADNLPDKLWGEIEGIFKQILAHPFLRGLTDGVSIREVPLLRRAGCSQSTRVRPRPCSAPPES